MRRRDFLQSAAWVAGTGAYGAALDGVPTSRAQGPGAKIRLGPIGTAHAHAAGKIVTVFVVDIAWLL